MEQLNFCFGFTLGTRDILFRLTVGRVCLNLYKGDFMGVCNSFITERSLGYARQIWPPMFLVLWSIKLTFSCALFTMWTYCTVLYTANVLCIFHPAILQLLCNDIIMMNCLIWPFNQHVKFTTHLKNLYKSLYGHYSRSTVSIVLCVRWGILLFYTHTLCYH